MVQASLKPTLSKQKPMKNQTKLSQLHKKRDELHKHIKDLKYVILGEMGTLYDRWSGYKILMESSVEAESKDWQGTENDQYRIITGECVEVWHCIAESNADHMKKTAMEHAKKAVTAQTKLEAAERELEQNWKDICKAEEEAKKEVK
jgi:cell division protein FtsB